MEIMKIQFCKLAGKIILKRSATKIQLQSYRKEDAIAICHVNFSFIYKDGVGCSPSCKCQGCKNIYGRKDSTAETKSELEETEALLISRTLPSLPYLSMAKPRISCSELFGSQNYSK
ncbi:unnamed protein product [Trifolium pratense]|uniref:Uncharacterized protein n=1 Tax=Trifolium pratense TaxID=57577 RepID=A0ACB0ID26_TRIPR|nr:unnamed protein product [Trifolium pratense]